jgi:hypothetical protein
MIPSQQKASFTAPITTAALSLVCSVTVAAYVLVSKDRRADGYHRIILAISGHIILHASALCFGSRPVPVFVEPPIYGASGTIATCEAQGFIQFSTAFAMILYYCSLPLVVFSRMCTDFVETRKTRLIELWIHLVCNIIPFTFAIVALSQKNINPVNGGAFCGINCLPAPFREDSPICVRGNQNFKIIFQGSAAVRLLGLAFASVSLVKVIMERGRYDERVKSVALLQASVHFLTLLVLSAIGLIVYSRWMKMEEENQIHFRSYVGIISLWSCSGVIHLISYFILRRTWIDRPAKPRLESDTADDVEYNTSPLPLVQGTMSQASKRWSLTATAQMRKIDWFAPFTKRNHKRWSFSLGDRPRPSKIRDLEQMQRLRALSNMKLGHVDQDTINLCNSKLEHGNNDTKRTIFDGTNPSKRWSAFILASDLNLEELEEDDEAKYYSDICQQEL